MKLILASSSRYRQELLKRLGMPFASISPDIDETPLAHESPIALVERLALAKASAIQQKQADAVIIGADQVAVHNERIIGKPITYSNARKQLGALSGERVTYASGVAVIAPGQASQSAVDLCNLRYRNLSSTDIDVYLTIEQPYDCAGSLKAEGLGIALLDELRSDDPTSIIGLPLIRLLSMLRRVGKDPLQA